MRWTWLFLAAGAVACDSEQPPFREDLVVEAYLDTGRPLPDVLVRRTLPPERLATLADAADEGVSDATVVLYDGQRRDTLRPVPGAAGRYRSPRADTVRAGRAYDLVVRQVGRQLQATTRPPPRVLGLRARAVAAAAPERGVDLDLASLGIGSTVANGYFYAVDVEMDWVPCPDPSYVVRANLAPSARGATLFFPTDAALDEPTAGDLVDGRRVWRRRYLVQVEGPEAALPPHRVRVALVRGGDDYRRFVETRRTPSQRSPASNVTGGLGIVAGVSVDSLTLEVR